MLLKLGCTCLKIDVLIFVFSLFLYYKVFLSQEKRSTYFHTLVAEIPFYNIVPKYGKINAPSRILCRDWLWRI